MSIQNKADVVIYNDGELEKSSTVAKFARVQWFAFSRLELAAFNILERLKQ